MVTVSELQVVVSADTAPAERSLSSFSNSMGSALGVGVLAAGAAVAAGIAVGVKAAGDLEQAVANISTIKPDIDTSAVFATLNEMSTRIPQSAAQLGDSLYNVFSSMDVGQDQAIALVETFAKGATAAQTDAETFGTSIMGVLNAYKLEAEDATHVSDVFFNTVKLGVVTGQELASSLGPVTQSAKAAGVGIDELGAMIAAVTKEGGPAAQNINNLNNFLQKITTKEAQGQLKGLGIATTDATGAFRPTADVLTDLKAKLGGMTEAARNNALQAIFPDAQARQGAMTLLSQLDLVKSATEENRNASGVAEAAYKTMSETFNSQSKLLMQGLTAILTTVGAALLPVITPLIKAFAESLPGAFAAAQAALAPFVPMITGLFSSIMASLPTIIGLVQGLFAIFSGGASMSQLVDVGVLLMNIFGPDAAGLIMDFVTVAGEAVRGFASLYVEEFGMIVSWVQENWPLIQQTIAVVLAAITQLWTEHGSQIVFVVQSAWTIVKTVILGALDIILSALKIGMQLITGDWSGAWDTLVGLTGRTLDRLGTIVGLAWDALLVIVDDATGGLVTSVQEWMTDTGQAITDGWQAAQDAISGAWDAITSTVQGAIDSVTSTLEGAWSAIGSAIAAAWDGFTSTIQGALDGIQSAISTVWNQIPEDIRTDLELIATTLLERGAAWVDNITTTGANMIAAVGTWLATLVDDITTWATSTFLAPIQGLVTSATTEATNVGTGMLNSFTTKFGAMVDAVTTWATSTFISPITGLVTTATSAALSVGSGMLTSIQGKLTEIVTAMDTWALNVVSAITGLVGTATSAASSVGQAIVNGIISGIRAIGDNIGSVLSGIVRGALQEAKNALGISSPSKVFDVEVGQPIVHGILRGLDSMSAPLSQALGGLVQTPTAAVASVGRGSQYMMPHHALRGGSGGDTYVTIDLRGAQVYDGSKFEDLLVNALGRAQRGGRIVKVTR